MSDDREIYPGAISNKYSSRHYLSRNRSDFGGSLTGELLRVVEEALENGSFVAVTVRRNTNWNTGDYYHPTITDVLYIEDTFTKKMFNAAHGDGDPMDDSMDYTVVEILHKDKDVLDSAWEERNSEKEKEDKIICDEFGYPI